MLENRPQILLELVHSNEHIISVSCNRIGVTTIILNLKIRRVSHAVGVRLGRYDYDPDPTHMCNY